jgi:anti-anti-sigma factor
MPQIQSLIGPVHRRRQHRGHRPAGRARDELRPGHTVLVTLPAELDLLTAPLAGDRLGAALTGARPVVIVDLTGTSYCDVAAVRMLLRLQADAAAAGGQLRMAIPAGPVRRVLELLGVDGQLDLYPTVLEAAVGPPVPTMG